MANDGQIVFEVTADGKHAIADIKDITKQIENETKKWDNSVKESTNGMDASFSGLIKKLSVAAIGAGIVNGLKNIASAAIQAASDLEEVQNVVDVTFGSDAGRIDEWAKNAGTQFGLTETQAKKFSSTMGAMLKSSGMAGQEIVQVSTDLAGLAADMASFYNLDFDTAFQKIRSGISGETMPLKELGINMSVATLNAFALEKGLTKTFDQMSQGEQTMLRYQYLMQATSDAQGDFARTSDGYANSMRKLETNIDGIKAKLGAPLLNAVSDAVGALNGFLELLFPAEGKKTVLDEFNEIEIDTESKMVELEATYTKANDIINLIDEISKQTVTLKDGSTVTFATLFQDIGNVEKNGGDIRAYLASLGVDVDYVAQKYQVWKEATKQLVHTVPELTSVINQETGAIDGGTDALKKNLDEWRANEEKKLAWAAYYAKERAVAERKGSMYLLEFDEGAAKQWVDRAQKALQNKWKVSFDVEGNVNPIAGNQTVMGGDWAEWSADYNHYLLVLQNWHDKQSEYKSSAEDIVEAERQLADGKQALIDKYGEEEKAAEAAGDAAKKYAEKSVEEWKTITGAAEEALNALEEHVKNVKDSVARSVDSTVKGFEFIGNASQRQAKRLEPLEKELLQLDKKSKNYEKTLADINERTANAKDTFGIGNLKKNLQSQMEFLREYKQDMEKARALGFSDEFLAQFADGSVESAEWLHELANASGDATKGDVKTLNDLYGEVQRGKRELTDTLTEQNLSVDEVYKNLADKAKEAVAALDMEGEAADNTGKTIEGIARGIGEHVDEVADQVDAIIAELDRLNGYGINIDFGGFGSINFTTSTGKTEGSGRMGLDYIPHDDYIARLHEGERVLTAQENQIWNSLLNGGVHGFDLDSLGGVMRDNIKAGGNVYLDGKIVGNVISDRQGKSYKSMQRSGWQV